MKPAVRGMALGIAAICTIVVAQSPYDKWPTEDVTYIITSDERQRFVQLKTDDERQAFIAKFWSDRDPTPDTAQNEAKEEHYRRIAYANQRFASSKPGWQNDRGRIYITFGPPAEIESHPTGQGGNPPRETWRYKYVEGIGDNVTFAFSDPEQSGEYRLFGSTR
jgi:GWxTD domain-containing protein